MNPSIAMAAAAVCFGGLAWGIGRAERKAKNCAVHDRKVGGVARVIGVFCALAALGLLTLAFSFWRSGE